MSIDIIRFHFAKMIMLFDIIYFAKCIDDNAVRHYMFCKCRNGNVNQHLLFCRQKNTVPGCGTVHRSLQCYESPSRITLSTARRMESRPKDAGSRASRGETTIATASSAAQAWEKSGTSQR